MKFIISWSVEALILNQSLVAMQVLIGLMNIKYAIRCDLYCQWKLLNKVKHSMIMFKMYLLKVIDLSLHGDDWL
jgi:hypothetical protein